MQLRNAPWRGLAVLRQAGRKTMDICRIVAAMQTLIVCRNEQIKLL
jgi:hypothetical protein